MNPLPGDAWRIQRRAAHEILTVHACKSYLPIQYAEVSQLMYEFLANTEVRAFILIEVPPLLILRIFI